MTKHPNPYLRKKTAKGRTYYYFDAGKSSDGRRILIKLPDIRDPKFGGSYASAKASMTKRHNAAEALTLDGLIRLYERSPEFRVLKENSQVSYSLYLARSNALIRTKRGDSPPAAKIERRDILTLRDQMADTPGAANQAIRSLQALFAWAVDAEKIKESPVRDIKKFPATPHPKWPDELVEAALADDQVGDAVALFAFTGQRIDDVVAMSWADVRGDHMLVWVKKKDKQIRVAILPELADRLKRMEKRSTAILTNANGQPWSASGLRRKLQLWATERGHQVVPHGLRKNAVISLLEAGCTAAEVSGITDQSIQMIEHYAREVNKLHLGRAAVVKLDAHRKAKRA
jgi:integrase